MILDWLKEDVVLGDGGAIFELERRGYVSAGPFTPEVVIEHPEALKQLQTDFARAGAGSPSVDLLRSRREAERYWQSRRPSKDQQ